MEPGEVGKVVHAGSLLIEIVVCMCAAFQPGTVISTLLQVSMCLSATTHHQHLFSHACLAHCAGVSSGMQAMVWVLSAAGAEAYALPVV